MATGVPFTGSNKVYAAPEGRDDVSDLHVFANGNCIVSAWELSDAELAEIVRTRRVFLSSFSGATLFPVFVGSESVVRSVVVDYGPVWAREGEPA
jgi:hypothetical protein